MMKLILSERHWDVIFSVVFIIGGFVDFVNVFGVVIVVGVSGVVDIGVIDGGESGGGYETEAVAGWRWWWWRSRS